jgi:D-glycero-alpha-D-manno-heptose 1-phosphate guanylyltransferase
METIILAGGFGKRLQGVVGNVPKPMAPVNNRPFLDYLLDYLILNKTKSVIISVFYKYDLIKNHYGSNYKEITINYSIDDAELGTGGAIKAAFLMAHDDHVFVINGDTYFDVNLSRLFKEHVTNNNDITLSLKPMSNFDRYGFVETDSNGYVLSLKEKKYCDYGEIDGGIYLIKRNVFASFENNNRFSFNDFIMNNLKNLKVGSLLCDELFIDIGTPEDYEKAHKVLGNQS